MEEEEEVLEMFDESIDRFEHSGFRPRRVCVHYLAARCEEGWSCTFPHGEQSILTLFVKQIVDVPAPEITVEFMKDIMQQMVVAPMPQIMGNSGVQICVRVLRWPSQCHRSWANREVDSACDADCGLVPSWK